jgi:hypothetical protein
MNRGATPETSFLCLAMLRRRSCCGPRLATDVSQSCTRATRSAQTDVACATYHGAGPFSPGGPDPKLRMLIALYPEALTPLCPRRAWTPSWPPCASPGRPQGSLRCPGAFGLLRPELGLGAAPAPMATASGRPTTRVHGERARHQGGGSGGLPPRPPRGPAGRREGPATLPASAVPEGAAMIGPVVDVLWRGGGDVAVDLDRYGLPGIHVPGLPPSATPFKELIRRGLASTDLSRKEIARQCGRSRGWIGGLLRPQKPPEPRVGAMVRLCRVLRLVPPIELD